MSRLVSDVFRVLILYPWRASDSCRQCLISLLLKLQGVGVYKVTTGF